MENCQTLKKKGIMVENGAANIFFSSPNKLVLILTLYSCLYKGSCEACRLSAPTGHCRKPGELSNQENLLDKFLFLHRKDFLDA